MPLLILIPLYTTLFIEKIGWDGTSHELGHYITINSRYINCVLRYFVGWYKVISEIIGLRDNQLPASALL